jgi:hypothetical protein
VTDPNTLKSIQNSTTAGSGVNARNLMNILSGSLSSLAMQYYINSPNIGSPSTIADWSDFRDNEYITIKVKQVEFTAWAKDEWKVTRNLTLTPGIRWDYTGVPYLADGTTIGLVGGGASAFGVSGRDFTGWMNPGIRAANTTFEFIGPGSPNPDRGVYPGIYNGFGPSFAFAYSLPWFGEGKTTIRGGYQITYSTGSPNPGQGRFSSYSGALSGVPGRTFTANAKHTDLDVFGYVVGSFERTTSGAPERCAFATSGDDGTAKSEHVGVRSQLHEPLRSEPDAVGHTQHQSQRHPGCEIHWYAGQEELRDAKPEHQQLPYERLA